MEEFLIRKSWLLKLLNPPEIKNAIAPPKQNDEALQQLEPPTCGLPSLPTDKQDKARKFAYAVRKRGSAKGLCSRN